MLLRMLQLFPASAGGKKACCCTSALSCCNFCLCRLRGTGTSMDSRVAPACEEQDHDLSSTACASALLQHLCRLPTCMLPCRQQGFKPRSPLPCTERLSASPARPAAAHAALLFPAASRETVTEREDLQHSGLVPCAVAPVHPLLLLQAVW